MHGICLNGFRLVQRKKQNHGQDGKNIQKGKHYSSDHYTENLYLRKIWIDGVLARSAYPSPVVTPVVLFMLVMQSVTSFIRRSYRIYANYNSTLYRKKTGEKVNNKSVLTIQSCRSVWCFSRNSIWYSGDFFFYWRHTLILYIDRICMSFVCFAFRLPYIVISNSNNAFLVALLFLLWY